MSNTFSPGILAALNIYGRTKAGYSSTIETKLGAARRLRIYRGGLEVHNVGSSGALTIVGGDIVHFGRIKGVTVRQAANLFTGACTFSLEGNGEWWRGTVGLEKAVQRAAPYNVAAGSETSYDLYLPRNLTTTSNLAFRSSAKLKPPRLMPTGIGPFAPALRPETGVVFGIMGYVDPANPVLAGEIPIDTRADDWVFEDAEVGAEYGDVGMWQSSQSILWGGFEFGIQLRIAAPYNSEDGVTPLEQYRVALRPKRPGKWEGYPFKATYEQATWDGATCTNPNTADVTTPPPCKMYLKNAAGQVIHWFQMDAFNGYPDLPLNSPQHSRTFSTSGGYIPMFNSGMMPAWDNVRPKKSALAAKYFPGVDPASYGPKVSRDAASCNGAIMAFDSTYLRNSINHFYAMPPYPLKKSASADAAYIAAYYPGPEDPNLFDARIYNTTEGGPWGLTGYKYQIGSITGHDWNNGFGGTRFDRGAIATIPGIYASDQNWVRPKGAVPIAELYDNWQRAYYNHACHYVTDVKTFATVPKELIQTGSIGYGNSYYGYGGNGKSDDKYIDLLGVHASDGTHPFNFDKNGQLVWNGWQPDNQHGYTTRAWGAVLRNDPSAAIDSLFDYNRSWMASLDQAAPDYPPIYFAGSRVQAFRFLHYAMQWKFASQHEQGLSRAWVEARFKIELETYYDQIYVPCFVNNVKNTYFESLRNLGVSASSTTGILQVDNGVLGMYMSTVLVMIKRFGLWAVMRAKNEKCRIALETILRNLDLYTIDYILDTDGRDAYYQMLAEPRPDPNRPAWAASDIPANWAAQKVKLDQYWPVRKVGDVAPESGWPYHQLYKNWITSWDNVIVGNGGYEIANSQHMQAQWIKARSTDFPEYPHARLSAAQAKIDGYYATVAAQPSVKYSWMYLTPGNGMLIAPSSVGPN